MVKKNENKTNNYISYALKIFLIFNYILIFFNLRISTE